MGDVVISACDIDGDDGVFSADEVLFEEGGDAFFEECFEVRGFLRQEECLCASEKVADPCDADIRGEDIYRD